VLHGSALVVADYLTVRATCSGHDARGTGATDEEKGLAAAVEEGAGTSATGLTVHIHIAEGLCLYATAVAAS